MLRGRLIGISTNLAMLVWTSFSSAGIVINTSQDNGFFTQNPVAFTALNAAVNDINQAINFNLAAINNDTVTGVDGGNVLNFNFLYGYTHPSNGTPQTLESTILPANQITIFAGARELTAPTLGQGGPGGAGASIDGTSSSNGSLQAAANQAMTNSEFRRGLSSPIIDTLSGTIGGANYSFSIGPTIGNLWFDNDTNDDNTVDDAATLAASWHFDHTTPVAAGKSDFYSVALHEVLHAIGFGLSETWDGLVSGNDWLGANVIALEGDGDNLVAPGHIASGAMSFRVIDGVMQEAVMTPSILLGTRKRLTDLDLAFLADLGYEINATAIPEPGSVLVLSMILSVAACCRRRIQKMPAS